VSYVRGWAGGIEVRRLLWWLVVAAVVVDVVRLVWPAILLAALVFGLAWLSNAAGERRAGLRARADEQHALVLAGDPAGVYGRFPPVDVFTPADVLAG